MLINVNIPAAPQRQDCPKPHSDPFYFLPGSSSPVAFIAPLPESGADGESWDSLLRSSETNSRTKTFNQQIGPFYSPSAGIIP